jgi:hypothetical protein
VNDVDEQAVIDRATSWELPDPVWRVTDGRLAEW